MPSENDLFAPAEPMIAEIDPLSDGRWDDFVLGRPEATAYHLGAWSRILSESYRHRPIYLASIEGGRVRGALPLFRKRGFLSGRRMRSVPVVPTGGPVAETPEMAAALMRAACDAASELGLPVGGGEPRPSAGRCIAGPQQVRPPAHLGPRASRAGGEGEWLAARPKNLSRSIKKALGTSLKVREATSEGDLRAFYRIYVGTMRAHGSPPRLLRQFRLHRETLGPSGVFRLFVVEERGTVVAGGIFHAFGDAVELLYNGSDPGALAKRPNHLLYRYVMDWARDRGFSKLDLGFAWAGTSLGDFKAQWGTEPVGEYGYTLSTPAVEPPAPAGRAPQATLIWRKLPAPLARAASGCAYRYL